jgi:hypothetical protein
MTALDDFISSRSLYPWTWVEGVPGSEGDGAPARELHEAYQAEMQAQDRPVLSPNEFARALRERGIESTKHASGHVYETLTVLSRAERAREAVRMSLWMEEYPKHYRAAVAEHAARRHPGGELCSHELPAEVRALLREATQARVDEWEADGRLDRRIERRYGDYLRWQPGEPSPALARMRNAERRRATTVLKTVPAQIVETEAALKVAFDEVGLRLAEKQEAVDREGAAAERVRGGFDAVNDPTDVAELRAARTASWTASSAWSEAHRKASDLEARVASLQRQLADAQKTLSAPADDRPSTTSLGLAAEEW